MSEKCAVILAGGEGKRMKSDKPKTLSAVIGKPMLDWVIGALIKSGIDKICVIKGYKKECSRYDGEGFSFQKRRRRYSS